MTSFFGQCFLFGIVVGMARLPLVPTVLLIFVNLILVSKIKISKE